MFFTGDIAQPGSLIRITNDMPLSGVWVGNLEGSLIDVGKDEGKGVYNNLHAIKELSLRIPFKAFGIANNHLLDSATVATSINHSMMIGVSTFGAGNNLNEARNAIVVKDESGIDYRLIAFGWESIQCIPASTKRAGVNPYTKDNVLRCVKDALQNKEPVLCLMHWDYELEKYPQPYDRQLAMDLIDLGVSGVIGCHAHRVQPVEFYHGKPIVYGLGNFLFYQGHYFGGKLRFPKFCEEEFVFEIKNQGKSYALHHFHYGAQDNCLEYLKSEEISPDSSFEGKAEFTGFDFRKYEQWFRKHRVQKKFLPIFYAHETKMSYALKTVWIKIRGGVINLLTKVNLKSANRANRQ